MKRMLRPQFQKNIYPDSVILLRGDFGTAQERIRTLSPEELQKTHWMPVDLDRRFQRYQELN